MIILYFSNFLKFDKKKNRVSIEVNKLNLKF